MGSIMSKIYDDYDDYLFCCNKYNVKCIAIEDSKWLDHYYELK